MHLTLPNQPPTFTLFTFKTWKMMLYFKKLWLLFNITAYSLHLAAVLPFYLKLNFFHYVIFNPDVQGLQKSIPSALEL